MIRHFFKTMSFTRKLVCIFLVTVLIPLLASTLIFYAYSRRTLETNTLAYQKSIAAVTMSKVETAVENVNNVAFYIAGNETIQEILNEQPQEDDRISRYEQYKSVRELLSYYMLFSSESVSAYILSEDGSTYSYTKRNQAYPDAEELWNEEIADGTWIFLDGHCYLRRGIYLFSNQTRLASLVIEADPSVFYEIVQDIFSESGSRIFIIDGDNNIIAGQDGTGEQLSEVYLEAIAGTDDVFSRITEAGERYILYASEALENGWRFVMAIPEAYILSNIRTLQYFTFALALITCVLAAVLIIFSGYTVTGPIKRLSLAMEQVGQGDLETKCPVESADEIGALSKTFNGMVGDMKRLIDNVYRQEKLKQEAEMKSLQMQINPHFLYNTLDTINWMARMAGVNEVGEMTAALGSLMRYSLSKNDFVTIDVELKNLRNYIEIQNVRYGDRMTITFEVEPTVGQYTIPKLLLQPILENAIVHGVEGKLDPGTIVIRIYRREEELYMEVEDDGVGMTQESIEEILGVDSAVAKKRGHTSIGVSNVNRRIQSVFGPDCGLSIQSQLGAGTKTTLHLRILRESPGIRLHYD